MTPEALPPVGFIGLGDQGLPMAIAIAEAGYPLQAWARRPASLEALAGVPHARHENIADLAAASDIVALCVSTDEDVTALVTGGLLGALRPGSVVVNHGTGTPGNAVRFAGLCAAAGVDALDAPVSGGRSCTSSPWRHRKRRVSASWRSRTTRASGTSDYWNISNDRRPESYSTMTVFTQVGCALLLRMPYRVTSLPIERTALIRGLRLRYTHPPG
jgi:hypothetical protein